MARPKASVIEDCLRRVVRAAVAKDEEITLKQGRGRAEKELGLEEGFFRHDADWNPRSLNVLQDAMDEEASEEDGPQPEANTRASPPPSGKPVGKPNPQSKASKAPSSKPTVRKGTKSTLSNERVDEDESSSEDSDGSQDKSSTSAAQKKPQQPKQVNGVKRKAGESSTSSEDSATNDSSSSDDSDDAEEPQKKKARKDESSSSAEESAAGSEEESDEDNRSRASSGSSEKTTHSATKTIPAIPPKQFVPPPGFTSLDAGHLRANGALSLPATEGKQLWHVTAPSNLSLASLTEISLDALRSGQPLFTRDGIEYIANQQLDSNIDAPSVLIATENGYQLLEQGMERSLHLQQKIVLPNLTIRQADQNAGSSAAAVVGASQVSNAKPQPKGLRMRYKPPGAGPGKSGILGADSETDENTADVSGNTGLTQDVDAMVVGGGKTHESSKKSEKKRKSTEIGESGQPAVNGISKPNSSFANTTTPGQPTMANGTPEKPLSKEEKKRLKRERKEAKQKAKEDVI